MAAKGRSYSYCCCTIVDLMHEVVLCCSKLGRLQPVASPVASRILSTTVSGAKMREISHRPARKIGNLANHLLAPEIIISTRMRSACN